MNKILNAKIKDDILCFTYIPEESEESGYVEYDLKKDDFIKLLPSKYDEDFENMYAKKATWYILNKLEKNEKIEQEYIQMWY